jgi:hypothetical protein
MEYAAMQNREVIMAIFCYLFIIKKSNRIHHPLNNLETDAIFFVRHQYGALCYC